MLEGRSIFTFDELVADFPRAPVDTIRNVLKYHVAEENLYRLRRGLYVSRGLTDVWLIASRFARDAVIAYESALEIQRPWRKPASFPKGDRVLFLTRGRPTNIHDHEVEYLAVRPPRALGKDWRKGLVEVEREDGPVLATNLGRTIVDVLDRLDLGPSLSEVWEALAYARPDPAPMVEHALALGNRLTAARLGFFLERLPGTSNRALQKLEALRPRSPAYFDRVNRHRYAATYFDRWNLMVPERLWNAVEKTEFRRGDPTIPKL